MAARTLGRGPDAPLRLAVVGLGKMGRLHVRSLQRLADVTIAALVDTDVGTSGWTKQQGLAYFPSLDALLGRVDAAIIATPADEHVGCAVPLLAAGIHCLVEKPLAMTLDDSKRLVEIAGRNKAVLAVGLSERFNAAVGRARTAMAAGGSRMEAYRMAPPPATGVTDADVVQDLLVHDLDWVIDGLAKHPLDYKVREARWIEGILSYVSCELSFPDGIHVGLTASRMAAARRREIHLHLSDGRTDVLDFDSFHDQTGGDPLTLQARAFVAAIGGGTSRIASGRKVLAVMALGDRIRASCADQRSPVS